VGVLSLPIAYWLLQIGIILAPPVYVPFSKIPLLYDGGLSSVHAVKAFSYLFGSIKDFSTVVVTVMASNETASLPNKRLIKEFIRHHYPKAAYVVLKGDSKEEIIRYLKEDNAASLLVLGAYHRSRLSRLFRPSMADNLLQHFHFPLFLSQESVANSFLLVLQSRASGMDVEVRAFIFFLVSPSAGSAKPF
jgi:nucleotide-binding universal stress UspA family protein